MRYIVLIFHKENKLVKRNSPTLIFYIIEKNGIKNFVSFIRHSKELMTLLPDKKQDTPVPVHMLRIPFRSKVWLLLSILWSLLLLYLSLAPSPPQVPGPLGWDKLQHAAALGCMAFLAAEVCLERGKSLFFSVVAGFISASVFGALIELLQWLFTVNREAELLDLIADMVGACVSMMLLFLFKKNSPPRSVEKER